MASFPLVLVADWLECRQDVSHVTVPGFRKSVASAETFISFPAAPAGLHFIAASSFRFVHFLSFSIHIHSFLSELRHRHSHSLLFTFSSLFHFTLSAYSGPARTTLLERCLLVFFCLHFLTIISPFFYFFLSLFSPFHISNPSQPNRHLFSTTFFHPFHLFLFISFFTARAPCFTSFLFLLFLFFYCPFFRFPINLLFCLISLPSSLSFSSFFFFFTAVSSPF